MTVKERLEEICVEQGMFENQARAVVELAMKELDNIDEYKIAWDKPSQEYPTKFYAAAFLTVARVALKWIDENIPQAWFRQMFDLNDPIHTRGYE